MHKLLFVLATMGRVTTLILLAYALGSRQQLAAADNTSWDTFVPNFVEAYFAANPDVAVRAGRHEFDGRLPDWSAAALGRTVEWLRGARQQALAFPAEALNDHQRFERDYILNVIDQDLFALVSAEWPAKNPNFYAGSLDPGVYVNREYAPLAERMRAYITYAKAVPTALQHVQHNLRTPLPRSYVELGKIVFGGLATYYEKDVPAVFAAVADAQLQTEMRAANAAAVQAMKGLANWVAAQQTQATDTFALGPELFLQMLKVTHNIEVSIDQLEQAGRQDLERNLDALRKECDSYAPGKTLQECLAKVQAMKPDPSAMEIARRQLPELKAFLIAQNLVTIPGKEEAQLRETPPHMRWNFAFIDIPGPYEKGLPSFYYISPPDPAWSQAERHAYTLDTASLLFASAHEVWPGHFLQYLHAHQATSKLGQIFVSSGFAEGWAHYTEEMMWEAGLHNGEPALHIAQLGLALLRNVRYLAAIGMHAKGMTVAEAERMFLELAYQDQSTARQQAARGTFDPSYLDYTLGKLMIRKLREEWTATRGGRAAWREFHDQFLSFGGPPIALIRKAMLGPNAGSPF